MDLKFSLNFLYIIILNFQTTLDGEITTKGKVINLEELYNFELTIFLGHLSMKIMSEFFRFTNFQMISDGKMSKTKILGLNDIFNFAIEAFSFEFT